MSIRAVVTRGYGNGTFSGSIAEVATRGYSIGEAVAGGGSGVRRVYQGYRQPTDERDEKELLEILQVVLMALDREL